MLQLVDPAVAMFPWHDNQRGAPTADLSHCPTLQAAIEQVAERYEFQWHPYFIWMRSVRVDQGQFSRSQAPFQYVIESFAESFAAVVAGQNPHPIAAINPPRLAFQRCLQTLDARVDLTQDCPIGIAAANRRILNHCLTQPNASGAATLGMIEYLYVDISATLAQIIQHRGWAQQDSNFYYMIHESLAINPSRDLFTLASATWDDPEARSQTARSLTIGAQYLWDLYDALYPETT
jgi:pyrroloquinoline-quinone synthase